MPALPLRTNAARGWMDFPAFRDRIASSLVPLDVSSAREQDFRGRLDENVAKQMTIASISATPHRVELTDRLIESVEQPFIKVNFLVEGEAVLEQDGRRAVLHPGDLTLYETRRPYSLTFAQPSRTLVLLIPEHDLGLPEHLAEKATAVRIAGDTGVGTLVTPFLSQLAENLHHFDSALGAKLARATVSMVATMVLGGLDPEERTVDARAAGFEAVTRYIDAHLSEAELSPTQIARANFMSLRKLHQLFSERGVTVAGWIREQRLQFAREELADPLLADTSVQSIAAHNGYVDPTGFSRAYRARFGETASMTRRRSLPHSAG